jgi:hypothetical protein
MPTILLPKLGFSDHAIIKDLGGDTSERVEEGHCYAVDLSPCQQTGIKLLWEVVNKIISNNYNTSLVYSDWPWPSARQPIAKNPAIHERLLDVLAHG